MIDVTAAVFISDGKTAAFRRGPHIKHGGRWEFPGGKIEPGETPQEGMKRELLEELALPVNEMTPLTPVIYDYPTVTVRLFPFLISSGRIHFTLTDHDAFCWVGKKEAKLLHWLEADLPVLHQVEALLTDA